MGIREKFGRRKVQQPESTMIGPRREFVYLDEISVYSLVASRLGSIPEQLSSSASTNTEDELSGHLGMHALLKSELGARSTVAEQSQTQVVRKSLVQGAFKELIELEQDWLGLPRPGTRFERDIGATIDEIEQAAIDDDAAWVVDARHLARGDLLELEVELDADPIFAFDTAISSMVQMMGENQGIFGGFEGVDAGNAISKLLGRLLVGLVPLRCRLLDYLAVRVGGNNFLVQRSMVDNLLRNTPNVEVAEIFLVGVAEEGLFWKDLRRVLFSGSKVTAMCRVARDGLQREWSPVKLADLYKQVIPQIGPQIDAMSTQLVHGFQSGASEALAGQETVDERMTNALLMYATSYATKFSSAPLDLVELGDLLEPFPGLNFDETEERRIAAEPLTERLRSLFEQDPDLTLEAELRGEAMEAAGFGGHDTEQSAFSEAMPETAEDARFLEAEFVAIYW